jgi:hypothetical protein
VAALGARLVEEYTDVIDKAALVINSAVNACMSWENIATMVCDYQSSLLMQLFYALVILR